MLTSKNIEMWHLIQCPGGHGYAVHEAAYAFRHHYCPTAVSQGSKRFTILALKDMWANMKYDDKFLGWV